MNAVLILYTLLKNTSIFAVIPMCEFRGFRCGAAVDSVLDEVYTSLLDNRIPQFRGNVLSYV